MSSGTMSDDEKTQTALRDTLEAVAGQTTVNSNWDRLVGDLDIERPSRRCRAAAAGDGLPSLRQLLWWLPAVLMQ